MALSRTQGSSCPYSSCLSVQFLASKRNRWEDQDVGKLSCKIDGETEDRVGGFAYEVRTREEEEQLRIYKSADL